MNIRELKSMIEDMLETGTIDEETEVRFASQPTWPFEYSIDGSIGLDNIKADGDPIDECPECGGYLGTDNTLQADHGHSPDCSYYDPDDTKVVPIAKVFYLVENNQIGYLPNEIKKQVGW